MTKAIFSEKQPAVTVTTLEGNVKQYQIALHETEVTTQQNYPIDGEEEASAPQTQYEYDWNEFKTDALTEEEVKSDPEAYLDYTPIASLPEADQPASIDARLKAIQDAQEETAQAVQDMLMAQMEAE